VKNHFWEVPYSLITAMNKNLRGRIRCILLFIVIVLTFPVWFFVYIRFCSFKAMGMFLSLFPGLVGLWLRRAFYYMMLRDAPTDISIGFCSVFLSREVQVGQAVSIGAWCSINKCQIGTKTLVGSHVDIFSGRHQHGNLETIKLNKANNPQTQQDQIIVQIKENVWIGNGVTLCNHVGENSIIGVGSVVVKPIPANCIAVGNPAKVIKSAENIPETI
jgi:acetyltransferase-like isoleucine patch superfamily enzyme